MSGLVVGITGSSGIIYALRLLSLSKILRSKYSVLDIVITRSADRVASIEEGINDLRRYIIENYDIDHVYIEDSWNSPLASSSGVVFYDMVIVPASLNTIAKLANGIQDNILLRAALSLLRMKRNKLVIVVRDTPLSSIDLRNLYKLSIMGAVILPASPGFYHRPRTINDLVDFIVGKILDVLGVENNLYKHWNI